MTIWPGGGRSGRSAPEDSLASDGASSAVGAPVPGSVSAPPWSLGGVLRAARHEKVRQLRRSTAFVAGTIVVAFWVSCAVFGEMIAPHDPLAADPLNALAAPSADHWFGTDRLGRDSFARVMVGGREILIVAPAAALLATVVGTALGLVAGYVRGAVDDVLSRVLEAWLALPVVVLATALLAAVGSSRTAIMVAVAVPLSPIVARSVRAAVLAERELEYIDAARVRTEGAAYIMCCEVLPTSAPSCSSSSSCVWRTPSSPPRPSASSALAYSHRRRTGGGRSSSIIRCWAEACWVSAVAFPVAAIATLVVGISLIVDGLTDVIERAP